MLVPRQATSIEMDFWTTGLNSRSRVWSVKCASRLLGTFPPLFYGSFLCGGIFCADAAAALLFSLGGSLGVGAFASMRCPLRHLAPAGAGLWRFAYSGPARCALAVHLLQELVILHFGWPSRAVVVVPTAFFPRLL